jgi:hypothetical protein
MAWAPNIEVEDRTGGGRVVSNIENGDFIKVESVDFLTGALSFAASVASGAAGGSIELHLGSATGMLLGTCMVASTGGWQEWETVSCDVGDATGIHDLYLVFKGGAGSLFNLDHWQFTPKDPLPNGNGGAGGMAGSGGMGVAGSSPSGGTSSGGAAAGVGGVGGGAAAGNAGTSSTAGAAAGGASSGTGGTSSGTGGVLAGAGGSAGRSTGGTGAMTGTGGAAAQGGATPSAGTSAVGGGGSTPNDSGCSLATQGRSAVGPWALGLLSLIAVAGLRRGGSRARRTTS